MKVFIISLLAATKRRELMRAQLLAAGLDFEFVDGVNGKALSEAELARDYDEARAVQVMGRPMTAGEIGCTLSHREAQRRIIEQNLPLALILEDDALLGNQALRVLKALEQQLQAGDNQLLLLTHVGRYIGWGGRRLTGLHRLYKPYRAFGAHGYLLTQRSARSLYDNLYPLHAVADWWVYLQRLVELRCVVPYCIGLSPLEAESVIGQARFIKDKEPSLRRWLRKYLYQKFLFQIVTKPLLRLKNAASTW